MAKGGWRTKTVYRLSLVSARVQSTARTEAIHDSQTGPSGSATVTLRPRSAPSGEIAGLEQRFSVSFSAAFYHSGMCHWIGTKTLATPQSAAETAAKQQTAQPPHGLPGE